MAKINDWIISNSDSGANIYQSEDGKRLLIRENGSDLAEITSGGGNILIFINKVKVVINETKKTISIDPRVL